MTTRINASTDFVAPSHVLYQGLSAEQVVDKAHNGQRNITHERSSRSFAQIVRANVFTLFNAIILSAMVIVLATGSWKDAVFGFVIIINTGIGIITELRSKRTLDKLSILVAAYYWVRRDGIDISVSHDDIVLGDYLWVRSGDQVPADGVVLENWGLELDESMLTGESRTVKKRERDTLYSGSTAVSGMALVEVSAVGEQSYAAKLTAQAKVYKKTISDLSRGINTILKVMTVVVVPLCALLIWSQMMSVGGFAYAIETGAWRGAIVSAVAGVVGMIPEGLVLLTSLNFAIAAMRLARHNTLVQELESVETLARVDNLNLDKTGTITDGTISFETLELLNVSERDAVELTQVQSAVADIAHEPKPNATGQAILVEYAALLDKHPVKHRVPFSSERKYSAITYQNQPYIWYMGAPEVLLRQIEINPEQSERIRKRIAIHTSQGSRVLLVMRAELEIEQQSSWQEQPALLNKSVPVAIVVCAEHIREDAQATLQWFREQGVRARVISGDSPDTVGAIAQRVGLTGDKPVRTMDAHNLPQDIDQLGEVLENVDVLGRVLPEQKQAIAKALQQRGGVVAMTGDGVNDALALKQADLGIAMGNAAPATKAVAQVVLVDSQFSHLPDVVARGRQVMANMERVATLFLVKTFYSALISFGVVLTQMPYPYLPRHISYVGALTIGIPAFILALAPNTRRYIPGFLSRVVRFALPGGFAIAISVLATLWVLPPLLHWQYDTHLVQIRVFCASIIFVLGIIMLARVAQPLRSWRGGLVALCALAGVVGIHIPFVAQFFELYAPQGMMQIIAIVVILLSVGVLALCIRIAPYAFRLYEKVRSQKK